MIPRGKPRGSSFIFILLAGCTKYYFVVNNEGDGGDSDPGDGFCRIGTTADTCTLRAAIEEANAIGGSQEISFNLPAGHETIYVPRELPEITAGLVIDGTTQPTYDGITPAVRISGRNAAGVIDGLISSGNSDVTIKALEVREFTGTGIGTSGKLTLDHSSILENDFMGIAASASSIPSAGSFIRYSTISGNGGTGIYSGGLYLHRRYFVIEHSTISNSSGPGISSIDGNLSLFDVSVTNNDASSIGIRYAGGIYFRNSTGTMHLSDTTIESNVAMDGGSWAGGIAIDGGDAEFDNCLITGNQGFASGGIYIQGAEVRLYGSTLTSNVGWHAGGVFLSDAPGGKLDVNHETHIGKPGEGNTASIYSEGYRYGGGIFTQRETVIVDSFIEENSGVGIQSDFPGSAGAVNIYRSTVDGNTLGGIDARNTNLSLDDDDIRNNGGTGIALQRGSLVLQNSNVLENDRLGLQILDAGLQIMASSINRNVDSGIAVASSTAAVMVNAQIQDSWIVENGRAGISAEFANLVVNNSIIQGNQASGIVTDSVSMNMTNSVLSDNHTSRNGGGILGAKIVEAIIKNSTISGNTADDSGGGAFFTGWNDTVIRVYNSTISGNTAGDKGGGIGAVSGTIEVNNATITENTASDGGGIFNQTVFNILNSVVAENGGDNCEAPTPLVSLGHNLEDGKYCGFTAAGDLTMTSPGLGPLADNGGPTRTHALLPGSAAIDAGEDATCIPVDQRWIARPQGPHCDIGAFEVEAPITTTPLSVTDTLTPGLTPTDTPTPASASILFDPVKFSAEILYAYGRSCDPKELTVEVKVTPAELVHSLGLFSRLEEKTGGKIGPWNEGLAMIPQGGGWYKLTIYGENLIGNFQSNDEIWVAIQFVANGKDGQVLARSPVYRQVTLGKCYQ